MASAPSPSYRYREEAPAVVSVPAAELAARLPEELLGESGAHGAGDRRIDLPCAEILRGNVPRITLGRLAELASGLVRVPEGRDPAAPINLPPGWIALHFRMVTTREETTQESAKGFASVVNEPSSPGIPESRSVVPSGDETPLGEVSIPPASAFPPLVSEGKEAFTIVAEEPKEGPAEPAKEQPDPPKSGFFSSLPMFRRTGVPEKNPGPDPADDSSVPVPTAELVPSVPVLERLWKLDPRHEIADGSALQALFMTDEKLTLEKVVSKAGELPGLDACVLAHGDRVICASKAPDGTDLKTLSGQAMTMLSQIRDSSEKMGLGSVPAVTLHADRGIVSFLHRGELCLLVLHADRGFVPGVRERLQEMLGHLSKAMPALPPSPLS